MVKNYQKIFKQIVKPIAKTLDKTIQVLHIHLNKKPASNIQILHTDAQFHSFVVPKVIIYN